ncbi:MAG: flagellar filament capping protein FliD [Vicinamibacterales bacterium]
MSTGITFSGFNDIDFNVVINALMTQASQPLTNLQTKQTALKSQLSTFSQLSTKVSAVQSAAEDLSSTSTLASYAATVSDSSAFSVSTTSSSAPGHYDIVVQELARAQVTASASTAPDANSTTVADGGSITINGTTVSIGSAVTLQGLAKAINDTSGIGATASVVQTGTGAFRLVLTGVATGASNAFTVQNNLTGGAGISFTDTDGDGLSGDSTADNAMQATDALLLVNNIQVSSASNTVSTAVPGTTLTLLKKAPSTPVSLDVTTDNSALQGKIEAFITAYNALQKFASDQESRRGGREHVEHRARPVDPLAPERAPVVADLAVRHGEHLLHLADRHRVHANRHAAVQRVQVQGRCGERHGVAHAAPERHGQQRRRVRRGHLADAAVHADVGMISQAQSRLNKQISGLDTQMANLQARLDLQRAALVKEYTAADQAMSLLKNQSGALSSFSSLSSK